MTDNRPTGPGTTEVALSCVRPAATAGRGGRCALGFPAADANGAAWTRAPAHYLSPLLSLIENPIGI
jgi:hypothetical protein